MKKLVLFCVLFLSCVNVKALDISEGFIYNKDFWKNSFSLSQELNYFLSIGLNFDLTEHKAVSNHIYTFSLPVALKVEESGLFFRPFFTPDNANEASAYGAKAAWSFMLNYDETKGTYTQAIFSAGFADQKAYITKTGQLPKKDNFYQLAYELNIIMDYFDIYFFEIGANIFQYPSGISSVENIAGVLDQQNIASLDTLDYVLNLPKGSVGAKIRWNSHLNKSENFISYRFMEFYDNDTPAYHSVQISSNIQMSEIFYISLAYNRIFISSQKDKNIFRGAVSLKF